MPGLGADAARGLSRLPSIPSGGWTTTTSGRLSAYLGLGGAGLLAGLLLSRPEPVILAAPLLLAAAVGLALARPPQLQVAVRLDRDRALEGEHVELEVEVRALRPAAHLELEVRLPAGLVELPASPEEVSSLHSSIDAEYESLRSTAPSSRSELAWVPASGGYSLTGARFDGLVAGSAAGSVLKSVPATLCQGSGA